MGLWSEYRSTLKSVEVEEPIDLAVHRPLAFALARGAFHTPLTPNQLTVVSMVLGVLGGLFLVGAAMGRFPSPVIGHVVGAALLFASAVVDCSDGMLARMRKSSSEIGRMLDGAADSVVSLAATIGSVAVILRLYTKPSEIAAVLVLSFLTVFTSQFHTSGYDFYKNLYLRMTVPQDHEGEDLEHLVARYEEARRKGMSLVFDACFRLYVGYLKNQRRFAGWFDPAAPTRLSRLPKHTAAREAIYRRHHAHLMLIWRTFFGVGSLMFGFVVSNALGRPDLFLLFRLVVLNAAFFFYLMPAQRRATRLSNDELGIAESAHREARVAA